MTRKNEGQGAFVRVGAGLLLALAVGAGAVSCKGKQAEPSTVPTAPAPSAPAAQKVQVTTVELGNALGADKRVKAASTSFSAKDTIFASVVTEGGGAAAELVARWTFQDGQLVNETKRAIAPPATPTAVAVTEFSIQKPDGWPVGEYKVEISLDGKPVETRSFKVQ